MVSPLLNFFALSWLVGSLAMCLEIARQALARSPKSATNELASKAAVFTERDPASAFTDASFPVEFEQMKQAAVRVRPLLAKWDEDNPGLLPVPHDGTPWQERFRKEK